MFTKDKKIAEGYRVRPFEVRKKVIDWDAVGGTIVLILMILGVLSLIF